MMEATHLNPFNGGEARSKRDRIDDKLRLALGRGLVAAYADVVREPIPETMRVWLRQLELKEQRNMRG
jgi:Anti-sigma factor NepR